MTDQVPQTPLEPAKRSLMQRVSIVWLIPLAALAIALGIAWQAYTERGALIEISFSKASGITADQTQVKFREVSVGVVEGVTFSEDLSHVVAHVRLDKEVEPFVDSDAVFWVVQPEVSARGVSGLQTVLSGVYIEGSWDEIPGGLEREFRGLDESPVARPDQEGTRITLSSTTGRGLSEGVPILFKGLEVGKVGRPTLSADGVTIVAEAFIQAPHDQLLTTQSRFWDASGISFNLGAGGASIDVESFAALITGGISFETVVSGGAPVEPGQGFAVFVNQDAARENLFEGNRPDGGMMQMSMVFDENVTGLTLGAPVILNGLRIGEVAGITGRVDPEQFGDERVRLVVVLSIDLSKLDAAPDTDHPDAESEAVLDLFEQAVAEGWRARLATTGLLSTSLRIEMVQIPDAEPAVFVRDGDPYPIFPSVPAEEGGAAGAAEGLIKRVGDLPIEDILNSAKTFLDNAAALVASEDIQKIPSDLRSTVEEVRGAVEDVRTLVSGEDLQGMPERLNGIADQVAELLADIERSESVAKIVEAIDKVGTAATDIGDAATGIPALVDNVAAFAAKADALDLEGILAEAKSLISDAGDIVASESVKALPESFVAAVDNVDAAIAEATALLSELNTSGAATSLTSTLDSVDDLASQIGEATEGVPALIDDIASLAEKVAALELASLVDQATGLVGSAREVVDSEETQAIPGALRKALDELGTAVADLRAGGTVENVNAALENVSKATADISAATEGVPALIEDVRKVAEQAAAMELDALAAEATGLIESAEAVLGTEDAKALPGALKEALDEVGAAVGELRAGGTVDSVNAALASAEKAAEAIATASAELPELVRRVEASVREAEIALSSLSETGSLNREARSALREVSRAADSVRSLMRTLERKPNALLTGK